MKIILIAFLTLLSTTLLAQNTGGGFGGYGGDPRPVGDERSLLEILRDRSNTPRLDTRGGGVSTGGGSGGTIPTDDTTLNSQGSWIGGGSVGPNPKPGKDPLAQTRTITLGGHTVTVSQHEMDGLIKIDDVNALPKQDIVVQEKEEVLPTRLHIESINLSSEEVTEITLKDGSVVKVEDLQEFVRQKMKEKLNQ